VPTTDGTTLGTGDQARVPGTMYYPVSTANVEFRRGLSSTLI